MKKALITLACVGLSVSAANACEYMRSAKAKIDQTVVASIATEADAVASTPAQLPIVEGAPVVSGDAEVKAE